MMPFSPFGSNILQPCLCFREGFFSRLDNSGCGSASSKYCSTPSNSDTKGNRTEQNHVDDLNEVIDILNGQSELENQETDNQSVLDGITDLVADVVEDVSWQDQSGDVTGQVLDGDSQENNASESSLETSQNEAREHCNIKEVGEASHEHFPQDGERSGTFGLINVVEILEQNLVQYIDGQESASQVEQLQEDDQENGDVVWQEASVEYNVLMDGCNEEAYGMHHEDGGNDNGSLLETTRNLLQWSYDQEPSGRVDAFYFPEDNVERMELRELLDRCEFCNCWILFCSNFLFFLKHLYPKPVFDTYSVIGMGYVPLMTIQMHRRI